MTTLAALDGGRTLGALIAVPAAVSAILLAVHHAGRALYRYARTRSIR